MKKILLIFSLFLFLSCDYTPIYSTKNVSFNIRNIEINKVQVNSYLERKLIAYKNSSLGEKYFDLKINTNLERTTSSKDKKGNPDTYNMKVSLQLEITNSTGEKINKSFAEELTYKKADRTEFELFKYEEVVKKNLIDKIGDDIIGFISTL